MGGPAPEGRDSPKVERYAARHSVHRLIQPRVAGVRRSATGRLLETRGPQAASATPGAEPVPPSASRSGPRRSGALRDWGVRLWRRKRAGGATDVSVARRLSVRISGDEGPERPATPQPRRTRSPPIDRKRPSDRRSPGMDPGPQGAFEVSMINVSCNSHYFSQLAAFFIDA